MCHSPGQRGRQIHLQQPGFEVGVDEHIETIQLCGGKTQTDQSQTGEVGTIRDPSDPIRENKGWRVSESPVFPRVYRGPITCGTWRRGARVVLLLITRMLYTQSLKKETLNHSCYRGIGSIALTKYTHVSSVTNLLMQGRLIKRKERLWVLHYVQSVIFSWQGMLGSLHTVAVY